MTWFTSEEAEGFTDGLEGPLHYPGRVAQHVPGHPARQVRGALGEVPGVLGVDVIRVDPGRAAVDAPAGAEVLGEVEQLVGALDPARRAREYCVFLDLQSAAPSQQELPVGEHGLQIGQEPGPVGPVGYPVIYG